MDGRASLSLSLGISQSKEYRNSPAASSPGFSALHGQVEVSTFFPVCWDRGSFKQPPLCLCSMKDSPGQAGQKGEVHCMIPLKALVFLHSVTGQNCLLSTQTPCLVQTLTGQRPRLTLFKAFQLKDGKKSSLQASQNCLEVVAMFLWSV